MCTTIELEEGWDLVEERIMKLKDSLEKGSMLELSTEECMMLYTTVYTMCTQEPPNDFSNQLYGKYRESLEDYMTSLVLPTLREKHGEFMLKELVKRWENHKTMVRWFFGFLHYLDRYYIPENSLPPLNEVGLTCFCDLVLKKLNGKVIEAGIALINQDREGEQIDQALIKTVEDIFVENGMDHYKNDFEVALLKNTSAYYSGKASEWFQEFPCPDYMLKVEECLKWEKDRVAHYLHSSNESKLLENVEHELLSVYARQLCDALLRDDKVEDLSRMFRLFSKIPKDLDPVYSTFKQHITEKGTALVKLAEDAASNKEVFVPKVIELHEKYLAYINDFILNHTPFDKALKDAFEIFCNKVVSGSSSAELLATFCHNFLKKGGSKELSVEAIEQIFEKVVRLLDRISDKDMFAEFHRTNMARRFLINKGANDVYEKSFLAKLKQQNGRQFTFMMEGMIKDLMLAKEKYQSFEEYLRGNPNADLGIHLTVTVLNRITWPRYKSVDLNLPAEMAKCVAVYKEFFERETKGKKLTWIYSLGTCKMIGKFERKAMKLDVTPYQASALLLFNASDRLSYSEIRKQLNLSDEDVKRVLHSLSCANYTILTKEPDTKTILSTDYFEFNSKFTHKMSKIQIPLPSVEKKKVIEVVDTERKYALEASIVRIMKSRKALNYQQLVEECVQQLRSMFKPDVAAIKKRIDNLISREFLERDSVDNALIKYVA